MSKVTVKGREYSDESIKAIIEQYRILPGTKVDIQKIKKEHFTDERDDPKQEKLRKFILFAFDVAKRFPSRYERPFKVFIPKKTWEKPKTVGELIKLGSCLGDNTTDKIELGLEFAQRISDGESWEKICNMADIAEYQRLVIWNTSEMFDAEIYPTTVLSENVRARLVGGSKKIAKNSPMDISVYDLDVNAALLSAVPSVTIYD